MSTTVFPYYFLSPPAAPYSETLDALDEFEESQGGKTAVIARASRTRVAVSGTLVFPQGDYDASDFWTWWETYQRFETFLYPCVHAYNRLRSAESLGTAAGGGGETFALDMKHILESSLVVYSVGAKQVLTTDYTVSGNNTAPTVTTTAAFDAGAVTADYTYYVPVRFASVPRVSVATGRLPTWDQQEIVRIEADLVEDSAGARYA